MIAHFQHNTYVYHRNTARVMLQMAEQPVDGSLYCQIASILFSVLCLEAYVNHVGCSIQKRFSVIDKKTRTETKMAFERWDKKCHPKISEKIGELGLGAFPSLPTLVELRDSIVHGKTEVIKRKCFKPQNNTKGNLGKLQGCIEKQCSLDRAKEVYEEVVSWIEQQEKKRGKNKHETWSLGGGSFPQPR